MTDGQYRALVAYMNYWTPEHPEFDLDKAIKDIGILDPRRWVIHELFKAGWVNDENTGLIKEAE